MIASFSALGVDLPSIALIVLHIFASVCLMVHRLHKFFPRLSFMLVCYSGDLIFHLLQGGRVSGSDVISYFHLFQYLYCNLLCVESVSSREYVV